MYDDDENLKYMATMSILITICTRNSVTQIIFTVNREFPVSHRQLKPVSFWLATRTRVQTILTILVLVSLFYYITRI